MSEVARQTAGAHKVRRDGHGVVTLSTQSRSVLRYLRQVRAQYATARTHPQVGDRAREWLLDNHYLIERQVRQVARDLPNGFVRRLPRLLDSSQVKRTRIDGLARELCRHTALTLDADLVHEFVTRYQEVAALTIAELWALPAVLRAAVVELLIGALGRLVEGVGPTPRLADEGGELRLALPDDEVVVRSIRCLHLLAVIDWKELFEATSLVERTLQEDPACVYEQMDFETRDRYRNAVEEIAHGAAKDEIAVSRTALSRAAGATEERQRHIGYWLVDDGRRRIEVELGFHARGMERVRRSLRRHPTFWYLGAIAGATAGAWSVPALYLESVEAGPTAWVVGLAVTLLPASTLAVTLVNWILPRILSPSLLPRLDLRRGVGDAARTFVVVPTLVASEADVLNLLRRLELHYLRNPEPGLEFALLTDFHDADVKVRLHDPIILRGLADGIDSLNRRYGDGDQGPFHAFHRERRWSSAERCWMGWERKRGKLEEFNRLLGGSTTTSFSQHFGDPAPLTNVRFVITLDTDTDLPRGAAVRLVGLLSHPLNRAVVDPASRQVVAGYSVVQPRVEIMPTGGPESLFSRWFAGDTGFDIYTRAVSDVYQDLFREGVYVGKGIYDVEAFRASLDDRVPENTLLSHDLFEGVHGRVALATDVVLFEDYPAHYLGYAKRLHRWVRGDWQLVPWLLPCVPSATGKLVRNRLSIINRWKVFDNLRRSMAGPALLLLLVAGWLWLPGSPAIWTIAALLVPAGHSVASLVAGLARGVRHAPRSASLAGLRRTCREDGQRWLLAMAFLVHESVVVVDALARVAVRMTVTRRRMLEWTTAARTDEQLTAGGRRAAVWREMLPGVLIAVALALVVAFAAPIAIPAAAPLLLVWMLAPEVARLISKVATERPEEVTRDERRQLRKLARRTWLFYETFVGPEDQWLPPDHFQEDPKGVVAHRTSPTNIAMHLLSTLAAHDMGYVGVSELAARIESSLATVQRLERYRGHLFNWYETRRLEPLPPRYVSSVDSGNLAGALVVLHAGCEEAVATPVLRPALWDGLLDTLSLIQEDLSRLHASTAKLDLDEFRDAVDLMQAGVQAACDDPDRWWSTLEAYTGGAGTSLNRMLTTALRDGARGVDLLVLRDLRTWLERLHGQLERARRDAVELLPWLSYQDDLRAVLCLPGPDIRLDEIPDACERAIEAVDRLDDPGHDRRTEIRSALVAARVTSRRLIEALRALAGRAENEMLGMDFSLFYDRERRLLHIGYDVTAGRADSHYYDLLATEARLTSYLAIIKRDVPQEHWYALGRPLTRIGHRTALLSWSATMFEYLMPNLVMRSHQRSLLHQSALAMVDRQIAYAGKRGVPWGISESGFHAFDADENYQYRAFGVPGLGFKRGLGDDLVVTPYASMLALELRPRAVLDNLRALIDIGMVGPYGLYEAIDFTKGRVPAGRRGSIVRSYMAHHQGMCLVAIDNFLRGDVMVRRFHSSSLVETGEMLLNEQVPIHVEAESPQTERVETVASSSSGPLPTWSPPAGSASPAVHLLSNGRMTTVLTSAGGGGISWGDLAVTRWSPGATSESGVWLHLRDQEDGTLWSAGRAPSGSWPAEAQVEFHAFKAELFRNDHGIALHLEVSVAPGHDVEVRRITVTNEGERTRRLSLTSSAEPVLDAAREADRHPAFAKLFLDSEIDPTGRRVLFHRRPRSSADPVALVAHQLVTEGTGVTGSGAETDRSRFLGRLRSWGEPLMLSGRGGRLEGTAGAVLDPVMAVQALVEIPPHESVRLAFVTAVAASREDLLELSRAFQTMHAVDSVFQEAEADCESRLREVCVEPGLLPAAMALLAGLMFPCPKLRAAEELLRGTLVAQPHLWKHGISGDYPILVARVFEGAGPLLSQTVAAHRYWRWSGVKVDLVLMIERSTGYRNETGEDIQRVLAEGGSDRLLGHRGGVFVIPGHRLPEAERKHLLAAASVVLDTRRDGLDSVVGCRLQPVHMIPPLPVTLPSVSYPTEPLRHGELQFENGIGGFTADGTEYEIHLDGATQTPMPWCNVLANESFGSVVSESGLGYTWGVNSAEHRITPWYNDPVRDLSGEILYLRDEETARVWSPTPGPAGGGGAFRVRHGIGYTEYAHEMHGLGHRLRVFVAPHESAKIVQLRLENRTARERRLTLTYFVEWVLGARREQTRAFVVPSYVRDHGCLIARCAWNPEFGDRVAFLTADREPHGFTCDRTEFLGADGDRALPAALRRWGLSGELRTGGEPCAALQVHLSLDPGETIDVHFVLGEGETRQAALDLAAKFRGPGAVEEAWLALRTTWEERLAHVSVRTPDPALDLMLNRWLPYQNLSARLFGRTGMYQSSGAYGFRDQLQDVMAMVQTEPELARRHILEAASHQFEEGDVLHWWHPPGGKGVRTRCSDDLLWLPFVTAFYVHATGDDGILAVERPFLSATPLESHEHVRYAHFDTGPGAPLLEHCRRAVERGVTEGEHGLPLIGGGDWNDGMDSIGLEGRGESVWLAWFAYATLTGFAEFLSGPEGARWLKRATRLREAIEESAWDGAWYRRAFHDDGSLVGSAASVECRIDSISQSWAVLSGGAPPDRAREAMCAARDQLVRESDRLVLLLTPPFDRTRHHPGYIRGYPPGVRENGGQYTHAATWLAWAFAELGDGAESGRILRLLNPIYHSTTRADVERYRVEPYVLAADVYSVPPHVGQGGWTWYTGAAGWFWRLGTEAILGLRLERGKLAIDPCLPPEWDGYEARIRYPEGELNIVVENPDHVSRGDVSVRIDGKLQTSNIVERAAGGHDVRVILTRRDVVLPDPACPGPANS